MRAFNSGQKTGTKRRNVDGHGQIRMNFINLWGFI